MDCLIVWAGKINQTKWEKNGGKDKIKATTGKTVHCDKN
jgi:hypothetical protein